MYLKLAGLALIGVVLWYVQWLRTENTSLTRSNTELSTKLKLQNDAVDELKTAAEVRAKEFQAKISKGQEQTKKRQQVAQVVYAAALPASASCESREKLTLDLVNTGR